MLFCILFCVCMFVCPLRLGMLVFCAWRFAKVRRAHAAVSLSRQQGKYDGLICELTSTDDEDDREYKPSINYVLSTVEYLRSLLKH